MADTGAIYTLNTPSGDIVINDTTAADCYIIDMEGEITGLDDPEVRSVFKPSPQTDGAYVGPSFLSGYRVTFSGLCVVRSYDPYMDCDSYRAAMRTLESEMRDKLRSILGGGGELTWEGNTLSNISYDSALQFSGTLLKHRFSFGISSTDASFT